MAGADLVERAKDFVEHIWNRGDFGRISDHVTEDYIEHRPEGTVEGIEGLRQLVAAVRGVYPDFRVELHHLVANERFVACTYTFTGTMQGDLGELEATGNPVRVEGIYMGRVEGDRLAEGWSRFDMLSVLTQLGVLSAPPAAADLSGLVASQQPRPPA